MKKLLSLFAIIASLTVTACGPDANEEQAAAADEAAAAIVPQCNGGYYCTSTTDGSKVWFVDLNYLPNASSNCEAFVKTGGCVQKQSCVVIGFKKICTNINSCTYDRAYIPPGGVCIPR